MNQWATAGIGLGTGLITGLANNALGMQSAKDLQELQINGQKEMATFNKQIALDMWERTGAVGQRKQLERAGLNVGLMYGGQGAGGMTSSNAGNVSGQNANMEQLKSMEGMAMMLQAQSTESQIELNKAQAKKLEAETENIGGVVREGLTLGNEMQTYKNTIEKATLDGNIALVGAELNKFNADIENAVLNNKITEATANEKIKQAEIETQNMIIEGELDKAKTSLTKEEQRAISVELTQEWERLYLEAGRLDEQSKSNKIAEFNAKWSAKLGIGNLEMRRIEAGLNAVGNALRKPTKVDARRTGSTTNNNY